MKILFRNTFVLFYAIVISVFTANSLFSQQFGYEYILSFQPYDYTITGNTYIDTQYSGLNITNLENYSQDWKSCTNITNPATCGDIVVGISRNSSSTIIAYNLTSNTEIQIATVGPSTFPEIDGEIVVWEDRTSSTGVTLKGFNLSTSEYFDIHTLNGNNERTYLKVFGKNIVWQNWINGRQYLELFNLDTKSHKSITELYPSNSERLFWGEGSYIVWSNYNQQTNVQDIFIYNIENSTVKNITNSTHNEVSPKLFGDTVIYYNYDTKTIKGLNLNTETSYDLCYFPGYCTDVYCSDNNIYFAAFNNIYKFTSNFPITKSCSEAQEVNIGLNNSVVYSLPGEAISSCGYNDIFASWCKYTPQQSGTITVSSHSQEMDTILSAYNGCGGVELACNDDTPNLENNTDSAITLDVVANKTIYFRVAGFNGDYGQYQLKINADICALNLRSDANNDCKVDLLDLAIMASEWLSGS